jgi:hypothetical protein
MIGRHKLEIMTLNTECSSTMRTMETNRNADIAQKRTALQILRCGGTANQEQKKRAQQSR